MKHVDVNQIGDPPEGEPSGYEGHESTRLHCVRCGATVGPGAKWVRVHDAWHERHGD